MRIIRHRLHGCHGSDHQATDRTDDTDDTDNSNIRLRIARIVLTTRSRGEATRQSGRAAAVRGPRFARREVA